MAEPDYTTYAKVRGVMSRATTEATVTDAEILAKHDVYAKPVIDGALAGKGAPWALGLAPTLVQSVATLLSAAALFMDIFHMADKKSEFVTWCQDTAMAWLDGMRNGTYTPSGIAAGGSVVVTDPTSDRAHTATIVGDETDWEFHEEERESD